MLKITPSYSDDLIRKGVRYQHGSAIQDPTGLAVGHQARQSRGEYAVESSRKRLGLSQRRLDQSKEQFDDRMGMAYDELNLGKKYGEQANRIALAGLGYSLYGKYKEQRRLIERQDKRDAMINRLKKAGDEESLFWADLMESM